MAQQFVAIETTTGKQEGVLGSTGGNGAADNGKVARYGADGTGTFAVSNWIRVQDSATANIFANLYTFGLEFRNAAGNFLSFLINSTWHAGTNNRTQTFQDDDGVIALTKNFPVKAWVHFDGTTAANVTGTYSRTSPSTTLTVTVTAHGHKVGHKVYCDFTTGTAVDGVYEVTSVVDANNFTITTVASTTTSGNVTLLRRQINASSGVHSVAYENSAGHFRINLSEALADTFPAVSGTSGTSAGSGTLQNFGNEATTTSIYVRTLTGGAGAPTNLANTSCIIVR